MWLYCFDSQYFGQRYVLEILGSTVTLEKRYRLRIEPPVMSSLLLIFNFIPD